MHEKVSLAAMAAHESPPQSANVPKAHSTLLRLGLTSLTVHFKRNGFIHPALLDSYDVKILKKTLSDTCREEDIR